MKLKMNYTHILVLLLAVFNTLSCSGKNHEKQIEVDSKGAPTPSQSASRDTIMDQSEAMANYIVEIFEDSQGFLWFGTMARGVIKYNPQPSKRSDESVLTYYTTADGLPSNTVVGVTEDKEGNLYFTTHAGISKYDGHQFENFTIQDGLCNDRVSNILIDEQGPLYIGTWGGVCIFDGSEFQNFSLPYPEIDGPLNPDTKDWVTVLFKDREGYLWIARDGYGASKFDGQTFTHLTKKDGLPSNHVQSIHEDRNGHLWIGTRVAERDNPDVNNRFGPGGLSFYDGKQMKSFPNIKGLSENDVYTIAEDKSGNLWIGATGVGVYQYDGESFTLFDKTNRMDLTHSLGLQSFLEDNNGNIWFGFSGGLFQLKDNNIVHIGVDHDFWKQQ